MTKKTQISLISAVIIAAILCGAALWQYLLLTKNNFKSTDSNVEVYIYPETSYSQLLDTLSAHYHISSLLSLHLHKYLLHWDTDTSYVPTGHYVLPEQMGSQHMIRTFQHHRQTPINLTFKNNIRTREQLASRLATQLMIDSAEIASALYDSAFVSRWGHDLNPQTIVSLFLPNTYEVYWDMTVEKLFARMQREYDAFWTDERLHLAEKLQLTPAQVATIASIVESETNRNEDKPIIAGLYLNRLRLGMPLQSCPTVIFAQGDFTVRRVTNAMLQIDSPYNTYRRQGLPPGPIRVSTALAQDAVLHATPSNYLFMCASTAFDGTHHFSATYAEHSQYARAYQRELNRRKIMK